MNTANNGPKKDVAHLSIAYLMPRLSFSGADLATLETILCAKKDGLSVTVITQDAQRDDLLKEQNIAHIIMPINTHNPLRILWNGYCLYRLGKEKKISLFHATARSPAWSGLIASWFGHIPLISTFHAAYKQRFFFQRIFSWAMVRSKAIIVVSDYVQKTLFGPSSPHRKKIYTVHSAPPLHPFDKSNISKERLHKALAYLDLNTDEKVTTLLVPARLTRSKGHLYLLDILSKVKQRPWQCVFVGSPPRNKKGYTQSIHGKIKQLGLMGRVTLRSSYKDMPALYAVSDIVIAPSLKPESFGRTLVEAQAAECIVISTHQGNAPAIIQHEHTGFLIPRNNVMESAKIIDTVLNMSDKKKKKIVKTAQNQALSAYQSQDAWEKTLGIYTKIFFAKSPF